MSNSLKKIIIGLAGATVLATAANAGGFSRGTADTDILYEEGNFVSRSSITHVSPNLDVTLFSGTSTGEIAESYVIPSFAMKLQATENLGCAGTYTTPFGGHTDYSGTTLGIDSDALATVSQEFLVNELALTCGYNFDLSKGRMFILGGIFGQTVDFDQVVVRGANALRLEDTGAGFRVGAAYEIPEIALRAQLMYRSEVDVDADGVFETIAGVPQNPNAFGRATLPQSVELKVQSGVAPGWLVYGSVTWTDWSVFDQLTYQASAPGTDQTLNFFYRDGWTVNLGVAHQFTEKLAGTASVTWDRGVGTGYDLRGADVWTVSAGSSFKANERIEFRGGLGLSYFGSDSQDYDSDFFGNPTFSPGFKTSDSGYAIGLNVSAKVKF